MSDGWEVAFHGARHQPAVLLGYSRSFNKASERNWGTHANPGPTLGLEPTEGGQCVGVAFEFPNAAREAVDAYLKRREGYSFRFPELIVTLPDSRQVLAVTSINDRDSKTYIGHLTMSERVNMAKLAKGTAGNAIDYVNNVRTLLTSVGIDDAHVNAFAEELRKPVATAAAKAVESTADELGGSMARLATEIKDIILMMPISDLLGYLWNALQSAASDDADLSTVEEDPSDDSIWGTRQIVLMALEYVHAVHSCFRTRLDRTPNFQEELAARLLNACKELQSATTYYCMASTAKLTTREFGAATDKIAFAAKTSWAFIRGHRYQGLEQEFLNFVLTPHDEALRRAYGIGAAEIAQGVQEVANAMRTGMAEAAVKIESSLAAVEQVMQEERISMDEVLKRMLASNAPELAVAAEAMTDMLRGGICEVSARSLLPKSFLDDLAFEPGENKEFYAPGAFCGTPMRTLPARIKPLIKIGESYFATDPYFVRDASYRAVQRGLLARTPEYRKNWNEAQKELSERAMEQILATHFRGARILHEVFYPGASAGEWVENDTLILLDDALVQIEAKAGVMAMHSPATDFDRHVQKVRDLVLKAYYQTKRFLEYANSARIVPLYELRNGQYLEVMRLCLSDYRTVIPIGLTIESFAPYSAMCKELPEVEPILGRYPFVSLAVDDLFVIKRVLPSGGQLLHYLEVRQQVAGIKSAFIFDEIDHLGSYITKNRFDENIRELVPERGMVTWDGFSKVIDDYFMSDRWKTEAPPKQDMPDELQRLLSVLDERRPRGWLRAQSLIRDLGGEGRNEVAGHLRELTASLSEYPKRWILIGDCALMFWLTRMGSR